VGLRVGLGSLKNRTVSSPCRICTPDCPVHGIDTILTTYPDSRNYLLYVNQIREVYRRILGPVYDNEKENWRILTDKEIFARVKKPTVTETIRLG